MPDHTLHEGQIDGAKVTVAKYIPLMISFEDGCIFEATGVLHDSGWQVNLPQGIVVTCPHGLTKGVYCDSVVTV